MSDQNLREKLSALEHEQWAHWTKYFLENITAENIARWKRQSQVPYSQLSELEKESDRKWADKIIAILNECKKPNPETSTETALLEDAKEARDRFRDSSDL